jgi:hypothetical protein
LDEASLRKAWWTLYWRGSAPVRERIMAVVDPASATTEVAAGAGTAVDADAVLAEVREFAALARHESFAIADAAGSTGVRERPGRRVAVSWT